MVRQPPVTVTCLMDSALQQQPGDTVTPIFFLAYQVFEVHDRMVVILKKEMLQLNLKSDDVDDIAVLLPQSHPITLFVFALFGHCLGLVTVTIQHMNTAPYIAPITTIVFI
jgi:hypothetical protein